MPPRLHFPLFSITMQVMEDIFEIDCPVCRCRLWVDSGDKRVIDHKRSEKRVNSSLEELLLKEKEKKEKVEERFKKAGELEKAKKKQAEELFFQSMKENPES